MSTITIASLTNMTGDTVVRPRVDGTTDGGSALTGDDPWRPMVAGTVTFTVTNASATNLTWRCVVHTKK